MPHTARLINGGISMGVKFFLVSGLKQAGFNGGWLDVGPDVMNITSQHGAIQK
jgi:hypothetical protein